MSGENVPEAWVEVARAARQEVDRLRAQVAAVEALAAEYRDVDGDGRRSAPILQALASAGQALQGDGPSW